MKLREQLLALMQAEEYVPLDKQSISQLLNLTKRDRRKLDYEIRLLTSKGEIVRVKKDRYCIPKDADLITGTIRFRQSGSAIVRPDQRDGDDIESPIEIDSHDTGTAMHGDQVVVRLYDEMRPPRHRPRRRGNQNRKFSFEQQGRVIRIQKRANNALVGNLQKTRFFYYVVPDDPRFINDIYVPDPAKSKITPRPKVGSKVVVKLNEWEQRHINPEGEIIKNLGETHEPQAELLSLYFKYNLEPEFPENVRKEAEAISEEIGEEQLRGRLDHRKAFTFTIDPDDAKDFDDALSLEFLEDGDLKIGIHIADVATYVRPGTALDNEAKERGNSTYLVGTVIPMLPHALSNGICSLKEDVDRLTKSVFLTFSEGGRLKRTDYANTVIRSSKRLTYKQAYTLLKNDDIQVARAMKLPPAHQTGSTGRALTELSDKELSDLQVAIRELWRIASKLRNDRMRKGSLDLEMVETKIYVDEQGYADRLEKVDHDESHQLIEEFMLAANEAVAREMKRAKLPCIYRTHDEPDEERLNELREFLATFGVETGDLNLRSEMKRLIATLDTHPQGHLLKGQVLRSMKKACYNSSPDGHYGLYKNDYCHFTSPIRRYSDLVVHRVFEYFLVKHKGQDELAGGSSRYHASRAKSLGEHLSATEVNSQEAERESVKIKLLEFFERELSKPKRTQFTAVITEVRNHGMFIELTESSAFGMVHISTLRDDLYRVNDSRTAIVGRRGKKTLRIGQKINVIVDRVDRFKRQVDFTIPSTKNKQQKGG